MYMLLFIKVYLEVCVLSSSHPANINNSDPLTEKRFYVYSCSINVPLYQSSENNSIYSSERADLVYSLTESSKI